MKKIIATGVVILFLFCNISFTTLSDENTGSLSGFIFDEEFNPLSGVEVTMKCSSYKFTCFSNETGYYFQDNIPVIDYCWYVTVYKCGYNFEYIYIRINENTTYNFVLSSINPIFVDDDNIEGPWDGSKKNPFRSIQDGIDAVVENGTVYVYNGTYHENLIWGGKIYYGDVIVNKSIDLIGEEQGITIIESSVQILSDNTNVSGFTIRDAESKGIYIKSSFNTVYNNTLFRNNGGLTLGGCNNTVKSNKFISNNIIGLNIVGQNNAIYKNKFISNNGGGINLRKIGNKISENHFEQNTIGIEIYNPGNAITNNTFFNDGLFQPSPFDLSIYHQTISNNTINGKPIVYLEGESNKIICPDAGQVILEHCMNISITNQTLSNNCVGIQLYSSKDCNIYGNHINNNYMACIEIINSSGTKIVSNYVNNGKNKPFGFGIYFDSSDKTRVSGNSFSNCSAGLWLMNSYHSSISNNDFKENRVDASQWFYIDNISSLQKCFSNKWNNNYWKKPRLLPYPIYMRLNINSKIFHLLQFDWHPAQEP